MNSAAIALDKEIQQVQLKLETLLEQRMKMEQDKYRFVGLCLECDSQCGKKAK